MPKNDRDKLILVSSNPNKAIEAERILGVPLLRVAIGLPEIQSADVADIKAKTAKLSEVSQKMGQAMYAASARQPGAESAAGSGDAGPQDSATGAQGGAGSSADDDVVDAEIVDDETDGPQDTK